MCRIVGVYNSKGSEDVNLIAQMRDTMTYGGPDDCGLYSNESGVYFGHRRLSILDLTKAGHQPYEWKQYTLIFNGEIYNFQEINQQLSDYTFTSNSDTETIIKAWDKWGIDAIDRFRGMFSFALWDDIEKKLFLVRDRIGVKPLFYQLKDNHLLFASELKALLIHPNFDKTISKKGLAQYLGQGYIVSPMSIFEKTKKVKPGHVLIIDNHLQYTEKMYWSAEDHYAATKKEELPKDRTNAEEWKEVIEPKLLESFKLRMVSDVPVGMFLSGGIDSSLVTAMLQKDTNQQLKTFTIGFENKEYNEAPFAKEIANHIGTDHHEQIVNENDFSQLIQELPKLFDEPNGDASIIPTHIVSKFAKEHVKVSLSADGGDEFFGGYTKYEITKNMYPKVASLPQFSKAVLYRILQNVNPERIESISGIIPILKKYKNLGPKLLKFTNALQAKNQLEFFHLASTFLTPFETKELLGEAYQRMNDKLPDVDPDRLISYLGMLDVKTYLEGDILTKVDRATMHTSLEGREPLLDHTLYEVAMQLPDELKIKGNQTKFLLRKILYDYVPKELIERPKQGFAIPLEKWLRGDLKNEIISISENDDFLEHFDLNKKEVASYILGFYNKSSNPQILWYLFVLYKWYNQYLK